MSLLPKALLYTILKEKERSKKRIRKKCSHIDLKSCLRKNLITVDYCVLCDYCPLLPFLLCDQTDPFSMGRQTKEDIVTTFLNQRIL